MAPPPGSRHERPTDPAGHTSDEGPRGVGEPGPDDRAEQVEQWFTTPVIVAAVASVPAMFLTTLEGSAAHLGTAINLATMAVFISETLVLLALTGDRRGWLRRHRFPVAITLVSIPAVIFALGPVQVLRLLRVVRVVGALRILRVRRIVKAGRLLRDRAGLTGWAWTATFLALSLTSAVFVSVVLADPSSTTRRAIDSAVGRFGVLVTVLAGAILGGATYVLARARRSDRSEDAEATGSDAVEGDAGSRQ